ncbi:MAG: membrane protein insertase YidC [Proteobacteria bacterium]|nr:membrane protein insertase YidC [Pseudomonadota bacterium]
MDFNRLILFGALGMVLMLLWQSWQEYVAEKSPVTQSSSLGQLSNTTATSAQVPTEGVPQTPKGSQDSTPSVSQQDAVPLTQSLPGGNRVVVETDLIKAEIDTNGGDLRRFELLDYPVSLDEIDVPFTLLNDVGADLFIIQGGLLGAEHDSPNHHTLFKSRTNSVRLAPGDDSVSVDLDWESKEGVRYTKTFTFYRDSYFVDVSFTINNQSGKDWLGYQYEQILRTEVAEPSTGIGFLGRLPSYKGGAIFTPEDKYQKIDFDDMFDANLAKPTSSGWVAMLQHYFVGALLPETGPSYEFYSNVIQRDSAPRYLIGYKTTQPTVIAPGDSGVLSGRIFVGPKETQRLIKADNKLELTVDYGWLTPVSSPLFWVMTYIHNVVKNWGVAIILLTLLVKLVFFPLSAASYKSMARMKKMQPRMQTLKERFGDDKQKFQKAMMEIYKKEKINPLGGCLPILIQIPVFIALYWVLLESVELRQAPFMLWIKDLSLQDPYYVLPILMGASMFGQQLLNPAPMDPMQQKIMMALPLVFTVFFLWFPSGLVLYWLVNNVLSIGQQWFITRKIQSADSKT